MTFKIDFMLVILVIALLLIGVSFWKAHRKPGFSFDVFDLIMADGKVDAVAVSYMLVLGVTTWVIIDLRIDDKLTEGYFTTYCLAWAAPLIAKFIFKKNDMPTQTTTSSYTTTSTATEASAPDATGDTADQHERAPVTVKKGTS